MRASEKAISQSDFAIFRSHFSLARSGKTKNSERNDASERCERGGVGKSKSEAAYGEIPIFLIEIPVSDKSCSTRALDPK